MSRVNPLLAYLSLLITILVLYGLGRAILPAQAAVRKADVLAYKMSLEESGNGSTSPARITTGASTQHGEYQANLDEIQICNPDTPDMLSYWPLDDGPGATTFADVVGSNDGACAGANCPNSSAGKVDSAFAFSRLGDPDMIHAPADSPSLNWAATDSFSFELWVNMTETCDQRQVFIGKQKDTKEGLSWASWSVGCEDNRAVFSLQDSIQNVLTITSTVEVRDGLWHHIVAGRDGAANLLYVDAFLQDSVPYTYAGNFFSDNGFTMGHKNVYPYYYFTGQLDEVAVYDRMLTVDEIAAHYNGGAGKSYCLPPPTAEPDSYSVAEDSGATAFDVLFNDSPPADSSGPLTIIAVGPGTAGGSISTDGSFVYYAPAANFFGQEIFPYTINDGRAGNNATATVTVDVSPVNDPPTANDDSFTVDENSTDVPLDVLANDTIAPDIEGTLTIINLGAASEGGSLTTDGSIITYTPLATFAGTEIFTYTINDGTPASDDSATVTVLVTPENHPPEVSDPGDQQNTEGDDVLLQVVASDPEGADLTFGATSLPSGLSIDSATGHISGALSFDAASGSPYTVNVSATDNGVPALAGSATFSWYIIENNGPDVLSPGDQRNLVGDNISLQIIASDADGDTLAYAANGLAPGLNIDPQTGLISGLLAPNSPGNWNVEVIVSDGDADKDASIVFGWDITMQVFLPVIIGN